MTAGLAVWTGIPVPFTGNSAAGRGISEGPSAHCPVYPIRREIQRTEKGCFGYGNEKSPERIYPGDPKPERKVIIKRGIKAEDYFAYCDEVSCEVWGILKAWIPSAGSRSACGCREPIKKPGTSTYVQGVEAEADYQGGNPGGV